MISSLQNTSVDWGYSVEKSRKFGKSLAHNITWPSGKLLGGTSAMNVAYYVRGNQRDFDDWEAMGNPTWGWQNVVECFKKAENYHQTGAAVASDLPSEHGVGGPLPINLFNTNESFKETLFAAAQELGYKQLTDLNGNEFIGIGNAPGIIADGKSSNSAKAYLSAAKDRANLHVIKNAHVSGVTVDNTTGQVTGVQFQINKTHDLTAIAVKDTILSAGSIGTPKIMQLSGIGPEKQLRRLNIPTVRNLQTGFSLQNHFTVPVFVQFNAISPPPAEAQPEAAEATATDTNGADSANGADSTDSVADAAGAASTASTPDATEAASLDSLYEYIKQRDVLSLSNIFDVMGFFNTVNLTDAYPNVATKYAIFKRDDQLSIAEYLNRYGLNESVAQTVIDANKLADVAVIFVTLLNPLALGKVRIQSVDPYELPAINVNLDRREDITSLVQGVQLARSFLNTIAFQGVGATEIPLTLPECETMPVKKSKVKQPKKVKDKSTKYDKKKKGGKGAAAPTEPPPTPVEPQPEAIPYGSDQYFECYVQQVASIPYGPVGTSKMGPITDRFAVVDDRLNVHGLKGLRVVDASIMPRIVSAPLEATTIMIAEKGSDLIKEDWAAIEAAAEAQAAAEPSAEVPVAGTAELPVAGTAEVPAATPAVDATPKRTEL